MISVGASHEVHCGFVRNRIRYARNARRAGPQKLLGSEFSHGQALVINCCTSEAEDARDGVSEVG
jgi:hypothetical protein